MFKPNMNVIFHESRRLDGILYDIDNILQRPTYPSLGEAIGDLDVFVAGEAEVNEPLTVEQPHRLLQQCNPPLATLLFECHV